MVLELRDWPALKRRTRVKVEEEYGSIMNPVAFSPDGEELALISQGHLLRYSAGGELIEAFPIRDDPRIADEDILLTARYVPDGGLAVLVDHGSEVFVARYDREGNPAGELIPVGEIDWVYWSQPFSADGRFLGYVKDFHIAGFLDLVSGEAREWDLREKLGVDASKDWRRSIWGMAVHPQGTEIALGLHAREPELPCVMRLDTKNGEVIEEFLPSEREYDFICSLAYSRDGTLLAAQACPSPPFEGTLFVYKVATGELEMICDSEKNEYCRGLVAFSPEGDRLILTRGDRVTFVEVPETG